MKNVLIIAYFFPPLGWSGVQRTLKFVKYLREFGWEPTVITVGKTRYKVKDESLMQEIPEGVKILRIDDVFLKSYTDNMKSQLMELAGPAFEMLGESDIKTEYIKKIEYHMEEIRNLLFIPDNCILWAKNVISNLDSIINVKDYDLIFTTSGPYSAHTIGYYIKQTYKLPWVADFRDEWTNNPYYVYDQNDIRYVFEKSLERKIVENADKVISVTPMSRMNYIDNFGLGYDKVVTITNGFDESDFAGLKTHKNEKFTIIYNGSFYSVRSPRTFLIAVDNLIKEGLIDGNRIHIKFIGTCDPVNKQELEEADLNGMVEWITYMPHKESIQHVLNADLLLLIVGDGEKVKSVYTGKVFEYLRAKKPILSISPHGSVVEDLLQSIGCGKNAEFNDIEGIKQIVLNYYEKWLNNVEFKVDDEVIDRYERKNLTGRLAGLFDEVYREYNK